MSSNAMIPAEILCRQDLPIYVKIVYGYVYALLQQCPSFVLTTAELAERCGITNRQAAKSLRYLVWLELICFHRSLEDRNKIHVFQKNTEVNQ